MAFSLRKYLLIERIRRYGIIAFAIAVMSVLSGLALIILGSHWLGIGLELAALFIVLALMGLVILLKPEAREAFKIDQDQGSRRPR